MIKISQRQLIIFFLPLIFLITTPNKVNAHELLIFVTPKIVGPGETVQATVYLPFGIREDGMPCESIEFSADIIDSNGSPSSSESTGVKVVDTKKQQLFEWRDVKRGQALKVWYRNERNKNKTLALEIYGNSIKSGMKRNDRPISPHCLPNVGAEVVNEQTGETSTIAITITASPKIKFM